MSLILRAGMRVPWTLTQVNVNDIYICLRQLMSGRELHSRAAIMSLAPLLDAAPAIPLHAFAAMAAFVLGSIQLAVPKGTLPHRTLGWIWVILMLVVAGSSFWIHQIQLVGPWSPIHLLSIFSLARLCSA
jgi:hypothetical protein